MILETCARAASQGASLLITPELATVGRMPHSELECGAMASDAAAFRRLADGCRASGIGLVIGYAERCSGEVFSSALVIDPKGHALANYRRVHLAPQERPSLAPGQWLTLLPIEGWRVGLLIGNDLLVPEAARCLAVAGADLFLHLGTAFPLGEIGSAPLAEIGSAMAVVRAIENGLPLATTAYDEPHAQAGFAGLIDMYGRRRSDSGPDTSDLVTDTLTISAGDSERRQAMVALRRPRLYQNLTVIDAI